MSNRKKPSSGKILIVDDEPDMLEMPDMIITDKTSHQVVTTNNPLEVGEILAKGNFNLVISDLKMPVIDSMDVIAAVKSLDADIPVVMITAFGTIESAEEAVRRGAYDFITKPFRKSRYSSSLNGPWIGNGLPVKNASSSGMQKIVPNPK